LPPRIKKIDLFCLTNCKQTAVQFFQIHKRATVPSAAITIPFHPKKNYCSLQHCRIKKYNIANGNTIKCVHFIRKEL
jgi:hypothetical protein